MDGFSPISDATLSDSSVESGDGLDFFQHIHGLPKVDLHRHLTGTITAATAVALAEKYGVQLPSRSIDELHDLLFSQERVNDLLEYFRPWQILDTLFGSLDAIQDIVFSAVEATRDDNIVYSELRLGARAFLPGLQEYSFAEYIGAVADAVRSADAAFGTTTRCILGIQRHVFVGISANEREHIYRQIMAALLKQSDRFVAVDLNGDELAVPAAEFKPFFDLANASGLPITIHAGELGTAKDVRYAAEHLHASRIGHGIAAARDETTMKFLASRGTVLEVCPSSNRLLGVVDQIEDLPLANFNANGVAFAVCTDNPARCQTTLTNELVKASRAFGYDRACIAQMQHLALNAAFVDPAAKRDLEKRLAPYGD